jgi:cytochrome oxidase Cu insertion factor (SCO1/SenC/PrrC family)
MKRAAFRLSAGVVLCALAAQAQMAPPKLQLKAGDAAPDFTLPASTGKEIRLSEFRGKKNVVLAFFLAAFTGG